MMNKKDPDMKYFFNDVAVSESDYNKLIADATEAHVALLDAAKEKAAKDAALELNEKAKAKKARSRKVAKMPAPVVEAVKVPAKKGSKTEIAAECIRRIGTGDKAACIVEIMNALGVTKGNASCYYFNVMKKGL
jgi:sRNA-binding protein